MTAPETNLDPALIADGMIIAIAGRTFRPTAQTSFKQDIYVMSLLKSAGLIKMAEGFDPLTDDLDGVAQEIIVQAFSSGQLFSLLGAVLEEVGIPWSQARAVDNAEFFADLRDPKDKETLHGSIVGVLMGFFVSGALSSRRSPKYSIERRPEGERTDPDALRDGVMIPASEERGTMESGTTSSETSPGTTPPATTT